MRHEMTRVMLGICLVVWVAEPCCSQNTAEKPADESKPTAGEKSAAESVPPATRNDYILRPGSPRPPLKGYRDNKTLSYPAPTGKKLDDLLKGDPKDDAALDGFAKSQTAGITAKGNEANASRDIVLLMSRTSESRARYDEPSVRTYKQAIYKYLHDLLDNSLVVQVNALHVASAIQNGFGDVPDGVPFFLKVLKDPTREDAAKLMALVGLINAKERNIVRAADEGEASAAILQELRKNDLQSVLEAKLYETLGALGRAYAQRPGDVQIASTLASAAINPSKSVDVRIEAGRALARMSLAEVREWNSKLQAQVIASALRDWVESTNEAQGKGVEGRRYAAYLWYKALAKALDQGVNQQSAEFKELVDTVGIKGVLNPLLQGESAGTEEIESWLEKHPAGDNKKLAPLGMELTWPASKSSPSP